MSSLNASLSIATQSLLAQETALQVTNNNIANVSTPGYSRQAVVLTEAAPTEVGSVSSGNGVDLVGIQSIRDELVTLRIQQQTSQQSSADAQVTALTQVQTLFPTTGSSVASDLSTFFTSLSALSTSPTDSATRQTVIASAQNLAGQFNSVAEGLSSEQSSLDTTVKTDVDQINQLAAQASTLNNEVAQQNAQGVDAGTLTDQLNQVELTLSGLTNLSVTHTETGDTLTTGNGTPLVSGGKSFALQTSTGSDGHVQVLDSSGTNITSSISGGDLGGSIQARDVSIVSMQSSLDTLASQFATAVNTAQESGYDQNGNAGTALFNVSSSVTGAAASLSMATTDPSAIAASSDASSGSNGNVANLLALQNSTLPAGSSATTLSSNLVYQVGSLTSNATSQSTAIQLSLTQLTNQQGAVSGVSIDEESANLIRYQQAYEAAAKVISTISSLFTTTLNMVSGS